MMDWQACFAMKVGTTYRVRYVRPWEDIVRVGTFTFHGEVMPGNQAIVVMDPGNEGDAATPGPIHILQIEEQVAAGDIR